MYIIAGTFKGRKIIAPKGSETRPTSGRLRETVFNILQNAIEGAQFLDLFAGSGAMGLEALSRGAKKTTFIDRDRNSVRAIEKNIESLQVEAQTKVICEDVLKILEFFHQTRQQFDLIFVDPPYAQINRSSKTNAVPLSQEVLLAIDRSKILAPRGILLIEETKQVDLETLSLNHLTFKDKRSTGKTALSQFFNASGS